jgi:hypothetical protein
MRKLVYAAPAVLCGLLIAVVGRGATPFQIEIVDDESGQPLAASVLVLDALGKPLVPREHGGRTPFKGQLRYAVDGRIVLTEPPAEFSVDVRRGFETQPVRQVFKTGKGDRRGVIRLKRWINMSTLGYLSGDTHVHNQTNARSHLQMRAEDLGVLNLLKSDFTNGEETFTGKLAVESTPGAWIYVGQEVRDWQNGHVILMGIGKLFEPVGPGGGFFRNRNNPTRSMAPALVHARQEKAVSSWAHFENLPGIESAVDIGVGLVDALDLITNNNPMALPSHLAPWSESGFSQAEFTMMRGTDLYYQFLNSGIRLPLGAGSDKMGEDVPVGNCRFYARLEGPPSYESWLAALKAGRGFITNHPILFFDVDGHQTGEVVVFKGSVKATARVKVQSLLPFINLDIVVNGVEVFSRSTFPWEQKPVNGVYTYTAEVPVEFNRSSWIAARATPHPDLGDQSLPRGLPVFAHSNAIHFLRDGNPVRVEASRKYLTRFVDGAAHWFANGAKYGTDAEKTEALQLAARARRFYSGR